MVCSSLLTSSCRYHEQNNGNAHRTKRNHTGAEDNLKNMRGKRFFLVNVSHKVAKGCKQSISYIQIYQDLWHSRTFKFLHSFPWPTMICLVNFANLFRETSLFRNTSLARHGEIRPQETQCHESFPEGERGKTHAPLGSKRAFLASPWKLNSSPLKIYHPIRKGLSSNHHFSGASC